MSKYRVRKVYEERYKNYVSNYHINQIHELEEGGAPSILAPEPISKDRLKNKNKQRQEPLADINLIADGGLAIPVLRPTWKVNTKYVPSSGQRLRLSMHDKAYERDSM
jgi:hypothetical protein